MMHGRSHGSRSSVWVKGFSKDEPERATAFGHLIRPAEGLVPRLWIGDFPVDDAAFREEWIRVFGNEILPPCERPRPVRANPEKVQATREECVQLRQFLNRHMRSPNAL
jgi:hypothetical protein